MRWSVIAILAVVGLLGAIALIGALTPREHRAVRAAEYHRDENAVWAAISDFPALGQWMPGVMSVTQDVAVEAGPRWTLATGEGAMTLEVIEADRPRRLVTRIVDTGQPFGGTWTYEVLPVPGGTRLTITEDGWISNPLFRFFAHYVFGTTKTLDGALQGLGRHFGETVTPREGG